MSKHIIDEHQETLTRALDRAIANGWEYRYYIFNPSEYGLLNDIKDWDFETIYLSKDKKAHIVYPHTEYTLIFWHSFAKALWGEELIHYLNGSWNQDDNPSISSSRTPFVYPMWQYHLKQMVIADDPIKYLGENI
jgi:hypothetical protein